MIYNKIFKQKERSELIELLSNRKKLNYNAKSALLDLVKTDEYLNSQYRSEMDQLRSDIEIEENSIASFSYLKYLGFRIVQTGNEIKVTRLSRFYFMDLLGILIGALLAGVGYFGLPEWKTLFSVGVSTLPAVISLSTAIVSVVGITLLIKSLSRYLEYSGFEIIKNETGLMIKKRNDILVDSVLVKKSSLNLVETDSALNLVYLNDRGEQVRLIRALGGEKVRKTLKHLKFILSDS